MERVELGRFSAGFITVGKKYINKNKDEFVRFC